MNPVSANPLLGVGMHAIGAMFASACYTPQKRVKGWSWQTYWLAQAAVCWFLLPIIGAYLTIPDLMNVLRSAPHDAMVKSFLLGIGYGVGGTAFGIAIRYIGFSLTYAIAIGLSTVLGTLIPPLVKGTLGDTLSKPGATWVIGGMVVGLIGIAITGAAGRMKENDLTAQKNRGDFSLAKGLVISIVAGVLSAVYGFSLEAGQPIADVATAHGAGIWAGNVVYIFSNTGAFLTTAIYCLYLHYKHKTLGEIIELPAGTEKAALPVNIFMAILTGCFWYGQFFFYNLGHVHMGNFKFTSWAIHMTMLVLFSSVVGVILREWRGCRRITHQAIGFALVILVGAVMLLTYGNKKGSDAEEAAKAAAAPATQATQ